MLINSIHNIFIRLENIWFDRQKIGRAAGLRNALMKIAEKVLFCRASVQKLLN